MKKISLYLAIAILAFGCSNNSEEDLVDCSGSDLAIANITSTKSGCTTAGSLSIEVTGGEAPYTYSIDGQNFQASESFGDLVAGNFQILVQDNIGCTTQSAFTLEAEDSGISLTLSSEDSDCSNANGSVTASASGGVGELEYSINGIEFVSSNVFTALAPGQYTVSVKDENNCLVSQVFTINTNTSLGSDIMPIISANCAISGCHSGSVSPNLSSSSSVISNAARIKSETQSGSMPRGRTLSSTQIDLIACWVDDGANNN